MNSFVQAPQSFVNILRPRTSASRWEMMRLFCVLLLDFPFTERADNLSSTSKYIYRNSNLFHYQPQLKSSDPLEYVWPGSGTLALIASSKYRSSRRLQKPDSTLTAQPSFDGLTRQHATRRITASRSRSRALTRKVCESSVLRMHLSRTFTTSTRNLET